MEQKFGGRVLAGSGKQTIYWLIALMSETELSAFVQGLITRI